MAKNTPIEYDKWIEALKETVPAKAHKFTTYTATADGKHTAICDTCTGDNKETDTQNCSGGIANCVDKKVCTVCNAPYGEVDGTNHKEITVMPQVDPTCQVKGKTSYQKCVCGVVIKEPEDIDTVDHVYGEWQKLEGENVEGDKHIRYCVNCVDTETLDIASETGDCKGGTAYCDKKATCSYCRSQYGAFNPDKHSSKETVIKNAVEATCQSDGYSGDVYYACCYSDAEGADNTKALKSEGEVTPKLAHDFTEEVENTKVPSTCSVKGTVIVKCSNCDATATKQLPLDKNNHSDMKDYEAQDATCQAEGWEAYKYCKDCGTYEVAKVTGCDYMKLSKIPPHVTVSALISDNEEALLSEMESIAETMTKDFIWFANIGVFNPFVVYLGPVMNEFLQNTCRTVNERLLQYADVGNRGRYLPNQWVPHAAIAVKLTPETLKEAFAIVQEKFRPFEATVERIVLVKAEPYEELRAWELK